MGTLLRAYQRFLYRYPVACQSLQAGILMGTGDAVAQLIVEKRELRHYQWKRTAQFFTFGTFFIGPSLTVWYRHLAHRFGTKGSPDVVIKKVAMDQLVFAPICIVGFIIGINTLQGKSFEHTKGELHDKYFDILITNYKIWPLVQLANFYLIPLHYQVLLVQTVAIFWNAYLSWKTQMTKV